MNIGYMQDRKRALSPIIAGDVFNGILIGVLASLMDENSWRRAVDIAERTAIECDEYAQKALLPRGEPSSIIAALNQDGAA